MWFFRKTDINAAAAACRSMPGAVLLDVREIDEFRTGHIPSAVNLPLSALREITLPKDTPLFVYCLRGSRARRAEAVLRSMGYSDVRSIGGIAAWRGGIEK